MLLQLSLLSVVAVLPASFAAPPGPPNGHYNWPPQAGSGPASAPAPVAPPATVQSDAPTSHSTTFVAKSSTVAVSSAASKTAAQTYAASSAAVSSAPSSSSSSSSGQCGASALEITIVNRSGQSISVNPVQGWTNAGGCAGSISNGASCTTSQSPVGANIRGALSIALTQDSEALGCGTLLEGNTDGMTVNDVFMPGANFDISTILGYSVPVYCTAGEGVGAGFNNSLCPMGGCKSTCNNGQGTWVDEWQTCLNPTGYCIQRSEALGSGATIASPDDSKVPFFEPVGYDAYTYPNQPMPPGFGCNWMTPTCTVYPQAAASSNSLPPAR